MTKKQTAKSTKKQSSMEQKTKVLQALEVLKHVRPTPMVRGSLTNEMKIQKIAEKFSDILRTLGMDLKNDSLKNTPIRIAKMYVNEIFSGLDINYFPQITVIENDMKYDQMVVVQDIHVLSTCEHHFQTIHGHATVAYIPNKKVIGLSKINRIVQFFARRPQVQERLTKQIADSLVFILGTSHVAVHINARHYCVIARGVEDTHSSTTTADLRGDFKERPETRSEFLKQCRLKSNEI